MYYNIIERKRPLRAKSDFGYHTNLLISCKAGYSDKAITDLLSSENFTNDISFLIESRFDQKIFLTIYSKKGKEKKFPQKKLELIEKLKVVVEYLSVLYDSQTVYFMQCISNSVYHLERELRSLIEIVFLKDYGSTWYKSLFQNDKKEKDRLKNRPAIIENLDNPLDSRDFVDLSQFLEENINISKETILQQLGTIQDSVQGIEKKAPTDCKELLSQTIELLSQIKEASEQKKKKISISDLYEHLTSSISEDWKQLYTKRNLWAHNYCLLTDNEFHQYERLANEVLTKIRTEITLLSLFEDNEDRYKKEGNVMCFELQKRRLHGIPMCKLIININNPDNHYLIEIEKATYKDLITGLYLSAEFQGLEDEMYILKNIKNNPFLISSISSIATKIIENSDPVKFTEEIEQLLALFKQSNLTFRITELKSEESQVTKDLNDFLSRIKFTD